VALPEKYAQLYDVFPIQLLEKHNPREDEDPLSLPDWKMTRNGTSRQSRTR